MSGKSLKTANYQGRRTFDFILGQVINCISDIEIFFKLLNEDKIFQERFLNKLKNFQKKEKLFSPTELAKFDIAYLIVFMGLRRAGQKAILAVLKNYYRTDLLDKILFYISKKPHSDSEFFYIWQQMNEKLTKAGISSSSLETSVLVNDADFKFLMKKNSEPGYNKFYGGFQYQLSHYYRNLFEAIKYINKKDILEYKEKKELIDILRAQISTPEQILFFFNSISSLGRDWEYNTLLNNSNETNRLLITKYNLVRNIHDIEIDGIVNVKNYYPLVHFEFEDAPKYRHLLEKSFN